MSDYKVERNELNLPIDEQGELKVDINGNLKDGREYRVRTFTLKGRGDQLFMLSTEPARCMGFRDSYLLFQKHRKLWKVTLNDQEKFNLIERDLIPHSYKGRTIGVVTARSIFREFGAKIIVGGHKVRDDYYEQEAIAQGHTEDEIADPDDRLPPAGTDYDKNQYVAWHGASSVYHQSNASLLGGPATPKHASAALLTSDSWLYEHILATSKFNSALAQRRADLYSTGGSVEPNVALPFYPENTQPKNARWQHFNKSGDVEIDTILHSGSKVIKTGLINVDPSIYQDLDDQDKQAILKQVQMESI